MGARESAARAQDLTDYLLTQRDEQGLIFCQAKGVDMYGISSWRNIIPYYTLDGAVTEINAEGVFALEAAAMLCAVAGDNEHWEKYSAQRKTLRKAMMEYLFNDDTGAFVLNYDQDQNYQDNFTADEVFPVLFNVADAKQRRAILERLHEADFVTPVGLRTISTADAWYFPSYGFGLLGGVWPDLTLWFVVALARNGMTDEAVHFLDVNLRDDGRRQPAQHRAGRVRRMVRRRLAHQSRHVSLAVDGREISLGGGRNGRRPRRLPHQRAAASCAASAERLGVGRRGSRALGRKALHLRHRLAQRYVIYGDMPELSAEEPFTCIYAGRDVSDEVTTSPVEVGAVAFEDERGRCVFSSATTGTNRETCWWNFADSTARVDMAAGELREVHLIGTPERPAGARRQTRRRSTDRSRIIHSLCSIPPTALRRSF